MKTACTCSSRCLWQFSAKMNACSWPSLLEFFGPSVHVEACVWCPSSVRCADIDDEHRVGIAVHLAPNIHMTIFTVIDGAWWQTAAHCASIASLSAASAVDVGGGGVGWWRWPCSTALVDTFNSENCTFCGFLFMWRVCDCVFHVGGPNFFHFNLTKKINDCKIHSLHLFFLEVNTNPLPLARDRYWLYSLGMQWSG